jgi:DNA polymerase III delta subunit
MEVFFRPLTEGERAQVAQRAAQRSGFTLDDTCAALAARRSLSVRDVVNVIQMAGGIAQEDGREGILPEDVQAICTPQISGQIFDMIGAVAARRQQEALRLYYDLLTMKEPPMRILFLIARQFNQLLQVKEAAAKTRDKASIAKACGLSPYVAGKMMSLAGNFSREILLSYLQLCVQTEEDVKTGRLTDRLAVELLIVQFSQRK